MASSPSASETGIWLMPKRCIRVDGRGHEVGRAREHERRQLAPCWPLAMSAPTRTSAPELTEQAVWRIHSSL